MVEETVSFYQIAKELAEEENITVEAYDHILGITKTKKLVVDGKIQEPSNFQPRFDNYRKKRQAYIEEILKKAGVLDKYKVVKINETTKKEEYEFRIPISQKEFIKFLLKEYTSAVSRKIRKDKLDTITTEEVEKTVSAIKELIEKNVPTAHREKEIDTTYALTQLQSRKAFDDVEIGLLSLIGDDLSQVKVRPVSEKVKKTKVDKIITANSRDKKIRIANDSDAAFLIYYYYHLMQQQSKLWNEIVDMVDELRTEEIAEMEEATGVNRRKYQFCDVQSVVFEAHQLVIERRLEDSMRNHEGPTPEQLKTVEEFLKGYGKDLT